MKIIRKLFTKVKHKTRTIPFCLRGPASTVVHKPGTDEIDFLLPDFDRSDIRIIASDELQSLLEQHELWVKTNSNEGQRLKLEKADLRGTDLSNKDLRGAIIRDSDFQGANLSGALFSVGPHIIGQQDEYSSVYGDAGHPPIHEEADLSYCSLMEANLEGADFTGAFLRGVLLCRAQCEGARFRNVKFNISRHGSKSGQAEENQSDLRWGIFRECDFQEALLWHANIQHADLEGADLTKADLQDVEITGSNLRDTTFRYAKNLGSVKGLEGGQLSGTVLTGVTLPEHVDKFDAQIEIIEQSSRNARTLFITLIAACFYSFLTIGTTTDLALIANSTSTPLPIINTSLPIVYFYVVAPALLLGVFLYFQLYLQRHWESLAWLPAVFPDGRTLDRMIFPWLLNGILWKHYRLLHEDNLPYFSRLQRWFSIFLAWWLVPLTLLLFWGRYIPRHDAWGSTWHGLILVLAVGTATMFQYTTGKTLEGASAISDEMRETSRMAGKFILNIWRGKLLRRILFRFGFSSSVTAIVVSIFTYGGVNGVIVHRMWESEKERVKKIRADADPLQWWVPKIYQLVGYRPFADLEEIDVSTKLEGWTTDQDNLDRVEGAKLSESHLNFAQAQGAYLAKADLRNAILKGGIFQGADLRGANLSGSNWDGADLRRAKLGGAKTKNASFRGADLRFTQPSAEFLLNATLIKTDLRGITLPDAELQKFNCIGCLLRFSHLKGINLSGAILIEADIKESDLRGSNLEDANMEKADLRSTRLQNANMAKANLSGAKLQGALLNRADLSEANLNGADLSHADLTDTKLYKADLNRANMTKVKGMVCGQLHQSRNAESAILPEYLKDCFR